MEKYNSRKFAICNLGYRPVAKSKAGRSVLSHEEHADRGFPPKFMQRRQSCIIEFVGVLENYKTVYSEQKEISNFVCYSLDGYGSTGYIDMAREHIAIGEVEILHQKAAPQQPQQ